MSPVTIPALTTIVDRQFKEDRALCPVRALRFYLDRTKDLRGSCSLLFISFKKGHTSDIRPATLSSWLKKKHSTLLQTSRPTNHASLSLESSQHIYKFLPKRPYLVGHRQQYVSVTRSGGTTSPRSFPSDQLSSERKKGGGGGTSTTTKSSGVSPRI